MTIDVSMQKEKEILARQWLANLKPLLGLDKDEKKTQPKHGVRGGKPSSKATSGVGKYADVSDDDDEDAVKGVKEGGGGDEKDAVSRHKDAFVKEAVHLMDIWFAGDDGDTQEKEELERVKQILRKVRSDPPIAPDEPVPITLRPFDVKPGDASSDIKFVYKHALSTVHDVKRQMAKRFELPIEALDLVLGRGLSDATIIPFP